MQYAIIRSGNKQYQAIVGKTLKLEKLTVPAGPIVFDDVLLHVSDLTVAVGTPTVPNLKVYGTVSGQVKGEKIQVFKYKSKSRYRKLRGHRQQYTLVLIESIGNEPVKAAAQPARKTTRQAPKKAKKTTKPAAAKTAKKATA